MSSLGSDVLTNLEFIPFTFTSFFVSISFCNHFVPLGGVNEYSASGYITQIVAYSITEYWHNHQKDNTLDLKAFGSTPQK